MLAPADPVGPTSVLVGYSAEEATRRARSFGYKRTIEVRTAPEFIEGCRSATVCAVAPRLFEMAIGHLTLYLNRDLAIPTPD